MARYEIRHEKPSEFGRAIGVTVWHSVYDTVTGERLVFGRYRRREDAERHMWRAEHEGGRRG